MRRIFLRLWVFLEFLEFLFIVALHAGHEAGHSFSQDRLWYHDRIIVYRHLSRQLKLHCNIVDFFDHLKGTIEFLTKFMMKVCLRRCLTNISSASPFFVYSSNL